MFLSVFVELRLKHPMVCESPLHGPRDYIDRAWERLASYSIRTFFLSRERNQSYNVYSRYSGTSILQYGKGTAK